MNLNSAKKLFDLLDSLECEEEYYEAAGYILIHDGGQVLNERSIDYFLAELSPEQVHSLEKYFVNKVQARENYQEP